MLFKSFLSRNYFIILSLKLIIIITIICKHFANSCLIIQFYTFKSIIRIVIVPCTLLKTNSDTAERMKAPTSVTTNGITTLFLLWHGVEVQRF